MRFYFRTSLERNVFKILTRDWNNFLSTLLWSSITIIGMGVQLFEVRASTFTCTLTSTMDSSKKKIKIVMYLCLLNSLWRSQKPVDRFNVRIWWKTQARFQVLELTYINETSAPFRFIRIGWNSNSNVSFDILSLVDKEILGWLYFVSLLATFNFVLIHAYWHWHWSS
jgi:hypothetical protein